MREQILRAATLCFFGNDFLKSADESRLTEVYFKACFKGVERLEFVRPTAHQLSGPGTGFVHGSKTWFRRLQADEVEGMRLHVPLSLLELLPAEFGVVTDGKNGCDIWVPSLAGSSRYVEYNAQRFAVWSLPRTESIGVCFSKMIQLIAQLNESLRGDHTHIATRVAHLAGVLAGGAHVCSGYDDCIPASFDATRRAMAKSAIHTIVTLSDPDFGLNEHPSLGEDVDKIWKWSLRLLEAISVDDSVSSTVAAA